MQKTIRKLEINGPKFIQLLFTTEEQQFIRAPSAIAMYIDGGALFGYLFGQTKR